MHTVLLVDDDDQLRRMCGAFLTKSGFRVLEAENGMQALLLAIEQKGAIDLLITDVEMPYIGGAALASSLKQIFPSVKVLFMSGSISECTAGTLPSDCSLLAKPLALPKLVQAAHSCIRQSRSEASESMMSSDCRAKRFHEHLETALR